MKLLEVKQRSVALVPKTDEKAILSRFFFFPPLPGFFPPALGRAEGEEEWLERGEKNALVQANSKPRSGDPENAADKSHILPLQRTLLGGRSGAGGKEERKGEGKTDNPPRLSHSSMKTLLIVFFLCGFARKIR